MSLGQAGGFRPPDGFAQVFANKLSELQPGDVIDELDRRVASAVAKIDGATVTFKTLAAYDPGKNPLGVEWTAPVSDDVKHTTVVYRSQGMGAMLPGLLIGAGIAVAAGLAWNWWRNRSSGGLQGTTSRAARTFIGKKIRILRHEGYGPSQASAVAYSLARKKGYKVAAR